VLSIFVSVLASQNIPEIALKLNRTAPDLGMFDIDYWKQHQMPADLKRDAVAAWRRFVSCVRSLPADQAAALWGNSAA
jgi:hypothetical protein